MDKNFLSSEQMNLEDTDLNGETGKKYVFEDQIFTEVNVGDAAPDDDDSTVWTDTGDNVEATEEEVAHYDDAPDMAFTCFNGHSSSVSCVAVHPSRPNVVITGGEDDRAFIWTYDMTPHELSVAGGDIAPSKVLSSIELTGHTDTVTNVGFNFDGSLALTGGYDGKVKIWKVDGGDLVVVLEGPEDIEWAEWHSVGNAVVAGSADGTAWMWLVPSGQCVQVLAGHDGSVSSGCFTKDGKLICTGGEDGTVRVWLPKSGACKYLFKGEREAHEAMVTCLVSSTDGDLILSGSADGYMKLFQLSKKKVLQSFRHSLPPDTEEGNGNNGTVFSKLSTVREDEADTMEDNEDEGEGVTAVECVGFCCLPEFKWVASGGMDKTLKVWDANSGAIRCTCVHEGSVVALKWHKRMPLVATVALDHAVRIWDARNGNCLTVLTGHSQMVTNFDMMPLLAPVPVACMEPSVATVAASAAMFDDDSSGPMSNCAPSQQQPKPVNYTDVIVSVSDDKTAKVFLVDIPSLLA